MLFYIEPVVFRDSPYLLAPWINYIRAIAAANPSIIPHLASSRLLCDIAPDRFASSSVVNASHLLEEFGFDRRLYMEDICTGDGTRSAVLLASLEAARASIDPDVVVSWTDNGYLRHVFAGTPTVYMELGPLPRLGFRLPAHLDPFGHQVGSVFDRMAQPIWDVQRYGSLSRLWEQHFAQPARRLAEQNGIGDWLAGLPRDRARTLLVLQPPDWLTYEGIGPKVDPLSLLRLVASRAGPDTVVIPQWHPGQLLPTDLALAEIQQHHRNVVVPPVALRAGQSELLLDAVDSVTTISSSVALAASVMGKRLDVLGRSKLSALSTPPGGQPAHRPDLIALLIARYCRPLDNWMTQQGDFHAHLRGLADAPESLLVEPEVTDDDFGRFLAR